MKKYFIICLLFFSTQLLFSATKSNETTFDISCALIMGSDEISEILNSGKVNDILNNSNEIKFSNYESNNMDYIYSLCETYISSLALNENFIQIKENNLNNEQQIELNKDIEKKYNSYSTDLDVEEIENIDDLINTKIIESTIESIKPKFTKIDNSYPFNLLSSSNNDKIISSLLNYYNSDAFLLISFEDISSYKQLKIEYVDKEKRDIIFNEIIINNQITKIEAKILSSFVNYFNDKYSLCNLNNIKNVTSIYDIKDISKERLEKSEENEFDNIKLRNKDLSQININNSYILLEKEIHFLQVNNNYISQIIKIDIDSDIFTIDYIGEIEDIDSLNLISQNGILDYYINGSYIDSANSVILDDVELPFYLEAKKDGFEPLLYQIEDSVDSIKFNLTPIWQSKNEVIDKAQKNFYSSLLSYVIISFTTLSINNINNAIDNNEIESTIDVFSSSIKILSTINIFNKLISYIKIATN
ncbi:MAG: hypothetical protein ACPKM0_07710 [Pleomorphochaeta sp.]